MAIGNASQSSIVPFANPADNKYSSYNSDELTIALVKRDDENLKLRQQHDDLKKQLKSQTRKIKAQEAKYEALVLRQQDNENNQSLLQLHRGKTGCYLTSASMVALGIRRNLTNISCSDVGCLLLQPIGRKSEK